MKTLTKHNSYSPLLTAMAYLLVPVMTAPADCGHCTGDNALVWHCERHTPNNQPPCPTNKTCMIEWMPPGIYIGDCVFTSVDIYNCVGSTYTGETTSREGPCQADCSCYIPLDTPPFEDHATGVEICTFPNLCGGS